MARDIHRITSGGTVLRLCPKPGQGQGDPGQNKCDPDHKESQPHEKRPRGLEAERLPPTDVSIEYAIRGQRPTVRLSYPQDVVDKRWLHEELRRRHGQLLASVRRWRERLLTPPPENTKFVFSVCSKTPEAERLFPGQPLTTAVQLVNRRIYVAYGALHHDTATAVYLEPDLHPILDAIAGVPPPSRLGA